MERELTLSEYKKAVRHVSGPRGHQIKNSWGVRDAFLYAQRNKWFDIGQALPEKTFQKIVRMTSARLAYELMEGRNIMLPENMGEIVLRKLPAYYNFDEEGKPHTNYKVDWDSTLKLWYEDEESRQAKTLVRFPIKDRFFILYNRSNAIFNNKCYAEFRVNRGIRKMLSYNIKQGKVDAFQKEYERIY